MKLGPRPEVRHVCLCVWIRKVGIHSSSLLRLGLLKHVKYLVWAVALCLVAVKVAYGEAEALKQPNQVWRVSGTKLQTFWYYFVGVSRDWKDIAFFPYCSVIAPDLQSFWQPRCRL